MKRTYFVLEIISVIIIWELIAYVLNINTLPSPINIIKNLLYIFKKELYIHMLYSLKRIVIGLFISSIVALLIGITVGFFSKANKLFIPIFYLAYPIPKYSLLPVIMILFGIGEASKIAMIVIVILFPMTTAIRDSCISLSDKYYDTFKAVGINKLKFVVYCMIKGILPSMFTSLRIGVGTALSVLFFTENIVGNYGIGYYIMNSWIRGDYLDMYTGIILMSLVGISLFLLIDLINKKVCNY